MNMKRLFTSCIILLATLPMLAQGWPEKYEGVMLQGFYWDSYADTKWTNLESQADELAQYFSLVWLPQSGNCGGTSMGYDDLYWFPGHYDSSFGSEKELRSLISTFKQKGIGTIADVVVNHRKNVTNWVDFPAETYKGVTYQLKSTDVCADDDGGEAKKEAAKLGLSVSSNKDTGEGWGGMRDLDHKSQNVQDNVKAYTKMLVEDMGYAGFRYDMVKGYSAEYTALYNNYAKPQFSVGECWDGTKVIRDWIDGTGKTSAAFDFQFRYAVRNGINKKNWKEFGRANGSISINGTNYPNWPLVNKSYEEGAYRRYAVTFVENHDTERRSNSPQDPIVRDTLAANAFLLAMPGTPCVFLKHWIDCKRDIKAMIDCRHAAGIQNTSSYEETAVDLNYYAVTTTGSKGKLLCVVGTGNYTPTDANFIKVLSGYHYAYYLDKSLSTAWADLPSGEYEGAQQVLLTAVSSNTNAQLVYTTDGSTPSATNGTKVASGTKVSIEGNVTLKVGLLIGSTVSGIITRNYTKPAEAEPFTPYSITVYVNASNAGWNDYVNFHSWGDNRTGTSWPGDKVTANKTINGKKWFYKTYQINSKDDYVNFVFSIGTSSNANQNQTVDVNNVNSDTYFEISNQKEGGKYLVSDVTSSYTAIETVKATASNTLLRVYTIGGHLLRVMPAGTSVNEALNQLGHGLYIINGKRYVK